jgi:glycosyltransferase involved in cell wall biosynthesis
MSFISVVIPVFNRAHLLPRTIESVLKQTYKNFEILLVDDHSTENILSVVQNDRVSYLPSAGKGVSAARNTGVRHAKGEWIAFLDSDDEWTHDKLEKQWTYLQQNPRLRFVHTDEIWMRNGNVFPQKAKHKKSGGRLFEKCAEQCVISSSTVLARKDFLLEMDLFDEDFVVCEDFDLWLRIAAQEEIGFLDQALTIKHGGHPEQLSRQYHSMDLWRVRALAKHINHKDLSAEQKGALFSNLRSKANILLKGYQKYPNDVLTAEIESYLRQAALTFESK